MFVVVIIIESYYVWRAGLACVRCANLYAPNMVYRQYSRAGAKDQQAGQMRPALHRSTFE